MALIKLAHVLQYVNKYLTNDVIFAMLFSSIPLQGIQMATILGWIYKIFSPSHSLLNGSACQTGG
jgi:hypothetical protein